MFTKINIQYLLSYLGLIPFFFVILNKYYLLKINEDKSLDFIMHYTLIIFVFIGALNWNLEKKVTNLKVFFGFSPSLIAVILIFLNLYNIEILSLILSLVIILFIQIIFEYFLIYSKIINKKPFYYLRIPLTISIIISLIIIIF